MLPILISVTLSTFFHQFPLQSFKATFVALQNTHQNSLMGATPLLFREFFEPAAGELKPSAKLLTLNGKRVRLVGFMAQMENPPRGAFYLCPRPVFCDEAGGGTADLPAEAVRVIVRSAKGKEIALLSRALEVTGILEVGNRTEEDGHVSAIRLILDSPQNLPPSPKVLKENAKHRKN